jgi:hypothetical protein
MTSRLIPLVAVSAAVVLWVLSIQGLDPHTMTDTGLVSILPDSIYLPLGLLIVSFCVANHRQDTPESLLYLHVAALIFLLHGTPAIVYETLRYSWAWKHVGIIDYIQRHHSLNPAIEVLGAYHNWPGFFTLGAFITEMADRKDALVMAMWAPTFFNLLYVGALLLIFKSLTRDRRLVWLGIWFFYLTNWVGQDYFAPQALNYFLHLTILGILLKWFRYENASFSRGDGGFGFLPTIANKLYDAGVDEAKDASSVDGALATQRAGLMAAVIVLFSVIAFSHQLTPFMSIAAVTALVVTFQCTARSLPVLMIVLAVGWIVYGARIFLSGELESLIGSFGRVSDNLQDSLVDLAVVSEGQKTVILMGRGLSVALWSLAMAGGLRRLYYGYRDVAAAALTVAPFAALVGTAYGGEVIFRIYFFSIPFAAFFAAASVYVAPDAAGSWRAPVVTILLSAGFLWGFGYAHYGKDRQYHFSKEEVVAARYLYESAPPGSLLIEGSRNYPSQFRNYENFVYVAIDREPRESRQSIAENPVEHLHRWMDNDDYTETYLLITRSQKAEVQALGSMPPGSLDAIEDALLDAPQFELIYGNDDAKLFGLKGREQGNTK